MKRPQDRPFVEGLESRKLMASGVLTVSPNNVYLNAVQGKNATYALRLTNTSKKFVELDASAGVRFKGDGRASFKLTDLPSGRVRIYPGRKLNVTLQFTAPGGTTAIQDAQLRFQTTSGQVLYRDLRGLPTKGEGGNLEPSLQKVLNFLKTGINAGQSDVENYLYPTNPSSSSEEINAQTFVKAGSGDVTIKPVAAFTNNASPAIRMGYYTPGVLDDVNYLWYANGTQTVNPSAYGKTSFDPGSAAFGLATQYTVFSDTTTTTGNTAAKVRNVYSENALNKSWDSSNFDHFRVFPLKDSKGRVVANSYLVAEEEFTQAYDNQDLLFVVTNVKPVNLAGTVSVQNLTGSPRNDILSFNKIGTPNADVGNIVRETNTVRVRNSGQKPLTITTGITGDFSIQSGAANKIVLAAGESRDVRVQFTANSGVAIHKGTLTISSDDPNRPTVNVALLGEWQQFSEQEGVGKPTVEPSAATIINKMLGYTTTITSGSQSINNQGRVQQVGDEILAQYFTAADTGGRVNVTALANFRGQTYVDSNNQVIATGSNMGWYTKSGNSVSYKGTVLTDKPGSGQMVLPVSNNTSNVAAGSFNPAGQTFGFVTEYRSTPTAEGTTGEYTEYALNPYIQTSGSGGSNYGQFFRFFPARDADGVLIPNTYIVLHDYNRVDITNFDFNDNVYLISNIVPVGQTKTPETLDVTRNRDGVRVLFTNAADGPKVSGFNVYRSTSPFNGFTKLNSSLVPAAATAAYDDTTADDDTAYYYQVTTVAKNGSESRPLQARLA